MFIMYIWADSIASYIKYVIYAWAHPQGAIYVIGGPLFTAVTYDF